MLEELLTHFMPGMTSSLQTSTLSQAPFPPSSLSTSSCDNIKYTKFRIYTNWSPNKRKNLGETPPTLKSYLIITCQPLAQMDIITQNSIQKCTMYMTWTFCHYCATDLSESYKRAPDTNGPPTTRMLDLCTATEVDFDIFQPEKKCYIRRVNTELNKRNNYIL